MKRSTALLLTFCMLLGALCLPGCGGKDAENSSDTVPVILDQGEYVLYQNIFYNDYGSRYEGKKVEKRGVFAMVEDAWNHRTRYYVWGYMDNTRCCDWQWEFVPGDASSLPACGSLVKVAGTFAASEDALDGYWIEEAAVSTETAYTGPGADLDMCAMSCTLERVQMLNILYRSEAFADRDFAAYGRIAEAGVLQDPYYDGSWHIPFTCGQDCPAIGTLVVLRGRVSGAALTDCTLTAAE